MAAFLSTTTGVGLVNTAANAGTITLPLTSDIPNRQLIVKDSYGSFSNNPLTLSTQTGEFFEDGTTTKTLQANFGSATLYGVNGTWYILGGTFWTSFYASSFTASTFRGDGSLLVNLPAVSTLSLVSSLQGLGTLGYVSSSQLVSTTAGLETYISTFIDPQELASSIIQFISTTYFTTQFTSTVAGLGTAGYVSTASLTSSINESLSSFSTAIGPGGTNMTTITSTVAGLGSAGYVSSLSLISTTNALQQNFSTISTSYGESFFASSLAANTVSSLFVVANNVFAKNNLVLEDGAAVFVNQSGMNPFSLILATSNTDVITSLGTEGNLLWNMTMYSSDRHLGFLSRNIGTDVLTLTSTGLVGIGKSPKVPLDISGLTRTDYLDTLSISTGNVYASSFNLYDLSSPSFVNDLTVSSGVLLVNGQAVQGTSGGTGDVTSQMLISTVGGLGSSDYISSLQLVSTTEGIIYAVVDLVNNLGTYGYISSSQLLSTTEGLGSAGYVSTLSLYSSINGALSTFSTAIGPGGTNIATLTSTVAGLGNSGYVSTLSLYSSINGALSTFSTAIGPGGTNMTTITSTVAGLGNSGYVSTLSLFSSINGALSTFSTAIGPGGTNMTTITSTVAGLGNSGYVSTLSLFSSINGALSTFSTAIGPGGTNIATLTSTVAGLGNSGYVSTLSLFSSINGALSTFSTAIGPGGTNMTTITSTVAGLGSAGYISSSQLLSTTLGLQTYISSFIDPSELASSVLQFISSTYFTNQLASTVAGLGTSGYISTSQLVSTVSSITYDYGVGLSTLSTAIFGAPSYQGQLLYLNQAIPAPPYKQLSPFQNISSLQSTITTLPGNSDSNLLAAFQTDFSLPSFIPEGVWDLNLFVDAGAAAAVSLYFNLYTRAPDASEYLLFASKNVPVGNTGIQQYTNALVTSYTNLVPASTIVLKIFGSNFTSPSRTVRCYFQDSYYSHIHTTFNSAQETGSSGVSSLSTFVTNMSNYFSSQILSTNFNLISTVGGLGQLYVSTPSLVSTTRGLQQSGFLSSPVLLSTVAGLGSAGYISSSQLVSTTAGLQYQYQTAGFLSSPNLVSTTAGLQYQYQTAGFISSPTIVSTVIGLGSAGYISSSQLVSTTLGLQTFISSFIDPTELASTVLSTVAGVGLQSNLTSTVIGLGSAGYISSSQLVSTTQGLQTFISSFIDPTELASTVLSTVAGIGLQSNLTSTVIGLGSAGYISSSQLVSTTQGLQTFISSFIDPTELASTVLSTVVGIGLQSNLTSTVRGLGTVGYISSSQLVSTTAGLQYQYQTAGFLSTPNLVSTTAGLQYQYQTAGFLSSPNLLSTTGGLQREFQTAGFLSSPNLLSTTGGLQREFQTAGFLSSPNLVSTTAGLQQYISSFIDPQELVSSLIPFISSSFFTTQLTSTVGGLGTAGYISSSQLLSTTGGLQREFQTAGFLSSPNLLSTTGGLQREFQTAGFISSPTVVSTVIGLGSAGYISSSQLVSTTLGLQTFISSFIDPTELASTVLSTVAGVGLQSNLTSTVIGLGSAGYISSSQLLSTTLGLQTFISSFIDPTELASTVLSTVAGIGLQSNLTSTVIGLGSAGYISSSQLLSTTAGLQYQYQTAGFLSSLNLVSTTAGLQYQFQTAGFLSSPNLVSTTAGIQTLIQNAGFLSSGNITSTVAGLGTAGYLSSFNARSMSTGRLNTSTLTFLDINTNAQQVLLVSSGTLTLNGAAIGGGGGGSAGLTVSDYVVAGKLNADQTLTADVDNNIQFVDDFDPQNWYNASTYFLTPTIAGYYMVTFQVWFSAPVTNNNQLNIQIQKNSTDSYTLTQSPQNTTTGTSLNATKIIYMNGSTDNLRFRAFVGNTSNTTVKAQQGTALGSGTFFTAALLTNGSSSAPLYSTVAGLGSFGYISTLSLFSTVAGLGTSGYVSTLSLTSSIAGSLSTFSTAIGPGGTNMTTITSTVAGLGNSGYVSTLSLFSSINGALSTFSTAIGPGGTNMTTITSTVAGLGNSGYVSTLSLFSSINGALSTFSTAIGPGGTNMTTITSTVAGLGNSGYVSTLSLFSSINTAISSFSTALGQVGGGTLTTFDLVSTVEGLGSAGYLSTASGGPISIPLFLSTAAIYTSSLLASTIQVSSITVDELIFGDGNGWAYFGAIQANAISTLQSFTGELYASYADITAANISSLTLSSVSKVNIQPSSNFWVVANQQDTVQPTKSLQYSFDGIQFYDAASGGFDTFAQTVIYDGTKWIAGGQNIGSASNLFYSYDGSNWTQETFDQGIGLGIAYVAKLAWNGRNTYVGVGAGSLSGSIFASSDGFNWSTTGFNFTDNYAYAITWNGYYWLSGGGDSSNYNAIALSYDGYSWSNINSSNYSNVNDLKWGGDRWVAAGDAVAAGRSNLQYSFDGIKWYDGHGDATFTLGAPRTVGYNGSLWLVGGADLYPLRYSYDGMNWSTVQTPINFQGNAVNGINWNGSMWVAAGQYSYLGSYNITYSYDGFNWFSNAANPSSAYAFGVGFSSNPQPAYKQKNLNILAQNIPLYQVSTNVIQADISTLRINNLLHVDSTWPRVGVNIANPEFTLDVAGWARISSIAVGIQSTYGILGTDSTASDIYWNGVSLTAGGGGGVTDTQLTSTTIGLGTLGYLSTGGGGGIGTTDLVSTVQGLGSANYISSLQLISTTAGLIDIPELRSTIGGLGTAGYLSTANGSIGAVVSTQLVQASTVQTSFLTFNDIGNPANRPNMFVSSALLYYGSSVITFTSTSRQVVIQTITF